MQYIVTTRDVDGSDKRVYKTKKAALERFQHMLGYSVECAISDQFYHLDNPPTFDDLNCVRGVSTYGCVVTIQKVSA
jgi:hypothetical protein